MTIKTFRGSLTDPAQITIRLSTAQGQIGYRIRKLQVMPVDIDGTSTHEDSVQIWTREQAAIVDDINFNNSELIAAAYYLRTSTGGGTPATATSYDTIIIDNIVINQDIYLTYASGQSGQQLNYYIELEVMNLSENEAAVSTLKDIRGS